MTKLLIALATTTALTAAAATAQETEFRIGLLGGENAQDRMASNECFRAYAEEALGVPVRLFTPADYNGVIQGLLGGSLDMAWLDGQGYRVLGVELSQLAVDAFFAEHGLVPEVEETRYGRHHRAGGIELIRGDAFALDAELLSRCDAVFDRAALVACFADVLDRALLRAASELVGLAACRTFPSREIMTPA